MKTGLHAAALGWIFYNFKNVLIFSGCKTSEKYKSVSVSDTSNDHNK